MPLTEVGWLLNPFGSSDGTQGGMQDERGERGDRTVSAPVITTGRLVLRPLEEGDLEAWAAFFSNPEATRLLHHAGPHSREHAREMLGWAIAGAEGPVTLYTVLLRGTDETVGFVGYRRRRFDWGLEVELGWLLLPAHQRQGYAIEAARALRPLVPDRVVSLIRVDNERSKKVARKLGMTQHERTLDYLGFPTEMYASDQPPIIRPPSPLAQVTLRTPDQNLRVRADLRPTKMG